MPGYASHILDGYLRDVHMEHPADAAEQYQLCLLRQWMDHLEVVMRDNDVPNEVAGRILREFLYGAMPQHAEAEMRKLMFDAHRVDLEGMGLGVPPAVATPEPR